MVDARDLKSLGALAPCRFKSGLRHHIELLMEKRNISRIIDGLDAEIISGGISYAGIIMNFSEEGLHLVTATANSAVDIAPATTLELKCKLPSGEEIILDCEVKWFQTRTSPHGISFSLGMGIQNPPEEYKEFVKTAK